MNLAVYKPNHTAHRLANPVGAMFDQLFADAFNNVRPAMNLLPPADVVETDEAFELQLHVPGFQKEDVKLELENGKLTVRGERKFEQAEGRTYRLAESRFGAFERTFRLPEIVDATGVSATLDLGILTIRLPKDTQKTAKHHIEIK